MSLARMLEPCPRAVRRSGCPAASTTMRPAAGPPSGASTNVFWSSSRSWSTWDRPGD
jgi:hypothetical protein